MKKTMGFTLMELMIVVAIAGILAATAFGFYGNFVREANRTEARGALTTISGQLEKCRSLYGRYDSPNCNVVLPQNTASNFYQIAAVGGGLQASSFELRASPIAGSPQAADLDCTTISLTNTGLQTATGANPGDCW